jgi:hypothetical protein
MKQKKLGDLTGYISRYSSIPCAPYSNSRYSTECLLCCLGYHTTVFARQTTNKPYCPGILLRLLLHMCRQIITRIIDVYERPVYNGNRLQDIL